MFITKEDVISIADFYNKNYPINSSGMNWNASVMLNRLKNIKEDKIDINEFSGLLSKDSLLNIKLQKFLFEIAEKNGESLPKALEEICLEKTYAGEKFNSYFKYIKEGAYYPDDSKKILEVVKNVHCETKSMFMNMLSLATLCKDDNIGSQVFAIAMDKRNRGSELSLLELEKVKKQWDKRFGNISQSTLDNDSLDNLKKYFSKITKGLNKPLINDEDGFYYKTSIDYDALSQNTKLTIGKVTDGMRIYLNSLSYFFNDNKDYRDLLSITEIEKKDRADNISDYIVSYKESEKKEQIKTIFSKLIDIASYKGESRDLSGVDIINKHDDPDVFFKTFIDATILELKLSSEKVAKEVKESKQKFKV